jgi:hypothetical protein
VQEDGCVVAAAPAAAVWRCNCREQEQLFLVGMPCQALEARGRAKQLLGQLPVQHCGYAKPGDFVVHDLLVIFVSKASVLCFGR